MLIKTAEPCLHHLSLPGGSHFQLFEAVSFGVLPSLPWPSSSCVPPHRVRSPRGYAYPKPTYPLIGHILNTCDSGFPCPACLLGSLFPRKTLLILWASLGLTDSQGAVIGSKRQETKLGSSQGPVCSSLNIGQRQGQRRRGEARVRG